MSVDVMHVTEALRGQTDKHTEPSSILPPRLHLYSHRAFIYTPAEPSPILLFPAQDHASVWEQDRPQHPVDGLSEGPD